MPVLAHSGFNGFEPKRAREHADISHYWAMAEALEDSPCILGHAAMNYYREAIAIAEKHPQCLSGGERAAGGALAGDDRAARA